MLETSVDKGWIGQRMIFFSTKTIGTAALCVCLMAGMTACGGPERPLHQVQVAVGSVSAGALSRGSEHAVVGALHHGVSLWRISDNERLYDWSHRANRDTLLVAASVSADGRWALTADHNTLALWDIQNGEGLRFWQAPGEILSVALDGAGRRALLGLSDASAVLFDVRRGGVVHRLNHNERVNSVAISDDGNIAVTGSDDYSAVTWNLATGEPLARVRHNDLVKLVALSPDGSLVMSMGLYDKATIWRSDNGESLGDIPLGAQRLKRGLRFSAARFSEDNRYLLVGRPDQRASLWRLSDMRAVAEWELPKPHAWRPSGATLVDVAFAGDNRVYALASSGALAVWDVPH